MATKSANLYARIEPDVKEQAEGILAASIRNSCIQCNKYVLQTNYSSKRTSF